MTHRTLLATIGGLALLAACSTDRTSPTSPADHRPAAATAPTTGSLLSSIPVSGILQGGTFSGVLSLTSLALQNGQLVGTGTLTGTAVQGSTLTQITQTLTNVPLSLLASGSGGSCQILTLSIGAIHLDLLGLVVNLAPVNLDIHAQPGPGNLLGNLLCAVTHLLDNPAATLSGLQNLLNQINTILAGL